MRRLALLASIFLGPILLHCATPDSVGSTEAANTAGGPLSVIHGREWARCSFAAAPNNAATLSCTSTARGDDPLAATVEVTAASLGSQPFTSAQKVLDVEQGGTVAVGTFPRASFPIFVMLHATFGASARAEIGETHGVDVWAKTSVTKPEDWPATNPGTIRQPFDIWPVAFLDDQLRSRVTADEYTRSIAPYEGFLSEHELELRPSHEATATNGVVHYLVAPASGPIHFQASRANSAGSVGAPGYFTVTSNEIRAATPAEIRRAFPNAPDGADAGAVDAADASDAQADGDAQADAGANDAAHDDVDAGPACGGPGELPCADGSCATGTRLENGRCIACGHASEPACYRDPRGVDPYTGSRCNAGTRYDASSQLCVACGEAGQTYCLRDVNNVDAYSGSRCSAGTRLDASSQRCVACGEAGQTYCLRDVNNVDTYSGSRCNAGTRLESASQRCVSCGALGEVACFSDASNTDNYSARRCNAGLRVENDRCVQ